MQSSAWKALARGLASSVQPALQQCQASSATLLDILEHNVPVGSTLHIDAAANIETATSGRHDVVRVASDMALDRTEGEGASVLAFRQASDGSIGNMGHIQAEVPERYCGIEIRSRGGKVAVGAVIEADCRVASGGGDIMLGKIKAVVAVIDSRGGAGAKGGTISGGTVSGNHVSLKAGGGAITLERMFCRSGIVSNVVTSPEGTGAAVGVSGGQLSIGAVYGDSVRVASGGDIRVETLSSIGSTRQMQTAREVDTDTEAAVEQASACNAKHSGICIDAVNGSTVHLGAVDGSVEARSHGGAVTLHVHDNMQIVQVFSGGGDIQCFIAPQMLGRVGIEVHGDLVHFPTKRKQQDGPLADRRCLLLDARALQNGTAIRSGQVSVTELSWIDALKRRQGGQQSGGV